MRHLLGRGIAIQHGPAPEESLKDARALLRDAWQDIPFDAQEDIWAKLGETQTEETKNVVARVLSQAEEVFAHKLNCLAWALAVDKTWASPELHGMASSLLSARDAISGVRKTDAAELKAFRNPPAGVREMMSVVAVLLEGRPEFREWIDIQRFMADYSFLHRMAELTPSEVLGDSVAFAYNLIAEDFFDHDFMQRRSSCVAACVSWARHFLAGYQAAMEPAGQAYAGIVAARNCANELLEEEVKKASKIATQESMPGTKEAWELLHVALACPSSPTEFETFKRTAWIQLLPGMVTLDLVRPSGENTTFKVEPSKSVGTVKQDIASKLGVPAICQKWVLDAGVMKSEKYIAEYFTTPQHASLEIALVVSREELLTEMAKKASRRNSLEMKELAAYLMEVSQNDIERAVCTLLIEGDHAVLRYYDELLMLIKGETVPIQQLAGKFRSLQRSLSRSPKGLTALINLCMFLAQRDPEDPEAERLVFMIVESSSPAGSEEVARCSVEALSKLGSGHVMPYLIGLIDAFRPKVVVRFAVQALVMVAKKEELPGFSLAVTSELTFKDLHAAALMQTMTSALDKWSPELWTHAATTLSEKGLLDRDSLVDQLLQQGKESCIHPVVIECSLDWLADDHPTLAKLLLAFIGQPFSIARREIWHRAVTKCENIDATSCAAAAVPRLRDLLQSRDVDCRLSGLDIVGKLPIHSVMDLHDELQDIAVSDWPHLRSAAADLVNGMADC